MAEQLQRERLTAAAGDLAGQLPDRSAQRLTQLWASVRQNPIRSRWPVAMRSRPCQGPVGEVPELVYIQPGQLATQRVIIDPERIVAIWKWSSKSEVFGSQIPSSDADGDGVAFDVALVPMDT